MVKNLVWGAVMSAVLLLAATSRSDTPTPGATGAPSQRPSSKITPPDPAALWSDESLSAVDRAIAQRGRDPEPWKAVHAGFAAGASELEQRAIAENAQHQLGAENLEMTGVVP